MARPFNSNQTPLPSNERKEVRSLTAPSDERGYNAPLTNWLGNVFTVEEARIRNQTDLSNPSSAPSERYTRSTSFYNEVDGISNASQTNYNEELTVDKLLNRDSPGRRRSPDVFTDFTIRDITRAVSEREAEFTNPAGSPITVAKSGAAPKIGNVDDLIRRYVNFDIPKIGFDFSNSDFTPSFLKNDGLPKSARNLGASSSKLPNPLREHNHYSYILTLGILTPGQYNSPETYRDLGRFDNYILKSAGGFYDRRYRVADEVVNGVAEDAEYYIEDLEIDAVIAPNPNTGVALGTTISFTVIEPFSMGNFIQSIIGASAELGWGAYTDAPFCLKIEFVGWDETGERSVSYVGQPAYIPVLITKIDFGVSGKGSSYEVQAVAYSESGLRDEVNRVKTPINAPGSTVHEVLTTNEHSVTNVLNQRVQELEDSGAVAKGDRYIICFPKDPTEITRLVQESTRSVTDSASISVNTNVSLYEKLFAFATDTSKMNEIGKSELIDNPAEGSDQSHMSYADAYDEENDIMGWHRPSEHVRNFQTNQNETVTHIIDKVLLESSYAEEKPVEESKNGLKEWFRVNTQVFIDPNAPALQQAGRQPKIFVYVVIPYYPDEAKTCAPSERPKNTEGLKQIALKTYNYTYTGKNEDVLTFDINFNNAFYQTAFADFGMHTGGISGAASTLATLQNRNGELGAKVVDPTGALLVQQEPTGGVGHETDTTAAAAGLRSVDVKRQIAEMFHDRIINQPIDMISAEMTIAGDPFFIPQQTGNYIGNVDRGNPNVITDGTIAYLQSEIFTIVNFRTPFDYQVQGASMEFPAVVDEFSGLFSVWAVTNSFSGGQFTQVLKMIRRRGQTDEATTGAGVCVVPDGSVATSDLSSLQKSVRNMLGVNDILGRPPEQPRVPGAYGPDNAPVGTYGLFPNPGPVVQVGPLIFDPNPSIFGSQPKLAPPPENTNQTNIYSETDPNSILTRGERKRAAQRDNQTTNQTNVSSRTESNSIITRGQRRRASRRDN